MMPSFDRKTADGTQCAGTVPLRSGVVASSVNRLWPIGAAVLLAGGCSTVIPRTPGQRLDPIEPFNRKVFNFNEDLDRTVLKPTATVYSNVVPQPVRQGVGNFFRNFGDAWSGINNILQGKGEAGMRDFTRFGMNSVFGVLGVFDVANELGLERQQEDFGQTLGHYGVGAGAYIVWPLLGPSSLRDSVAIPLDRAASPAYLLDGGAAFYALTGVQIINTRANLLGATNVIDDIALDKYTFVRDAYLQRRRSLIEDGRQPSDKAGATEPPAALPSEVPASAAPAASASL